MLFTRNIAQCFSNIQLAHDFHQRAVCYFNKADSIFNREPPDTFCYIRGNGNCGTLYLINKSMLFLGRELLSHRINIRHQLFCQVVHSQFLEIKIISTLHYFPTFTYPLSTLHYPPSTKFLPLSTKTNSLSPLSSIIYPPPIISNQTSGGERSSSPA